MLDEMSLSKMKISTKMTQMKTSTKMTQMKISKIIFLK